MKRRGYLKHYNDATQGQTISNCLAEKEPYCVVLFWLIMEVCNQNDSANGSIEIRKLSRLIHLRSDKLLKKISRSSELLPELNLNLIGDKLEFRAANYSKYQETRGKKDVKNAAKKVPIKDKRLKIKDKRLKIKEKVTENSSLKNPVVDFENYIQAQTRFDLDSVLRLYPIKVERKTGIGILSKFIKDQESFDFIKSCVEGYRRRCIDDGTEARFIKSLYNFFDNGFHKQFSDPNHGELNFDKKEKIDEGWQKFLKGDDPWSG